MLLKRLAVGGMAELFLANDTSTDEQVVIKRILPYLSHEADFVQMFLDEARIAAQLHHPNIIQVHELGKLQESMFIAMEFVDGTDLRKIFQEEAKRGLTIPYGVAALVTARVCAGLYYAHNATGVDGKKLGVIHRDISPQNVMVGFDGKVKLVDFGIAKATSFMERSKPGVIKGKFLYLSPEQLSQERVDHRADLFALGSMLYELTIGKSPFYRPTTEAVIYAIRTDEPQSPTLLRSDYPPELARIVMKCLVKDRNQRYQQAGEIQADLEAFLAASLPTTDDDLRTYVQRLFAREEAQSNPARVPPIQKKPTGRREPPPEPPSRKPSSAAMSAEPIARSPSGAGAEIRAAPPLGRKPTLTSGRPVPEPAIEARTKLASPDELPRAAPPVAALPMRKPSGTRYPGAGLGGPEQSVTRETLDLLSGNRRTDEALPPAPPLTWDPEGEMTLPPEDAARAHQLQHSNLVDEDDDGEMTIPLPAVAPKRGAPPSKGARVGAEGVLPDATGSVPGLHADEDDGTPLTAAPLGALDEGGADDADDEEGESSSATVWEAPRSKARRPPSGVAAAAAPPARLAQVQRSPAWLVLGGILAMIVVGGGVIYYLASSNERPPVPVHVTHPEVTPAPTSEPSPEAAPVVEARPVRTRPATARDLLSLVFDGPKGATVTLAGRPVALGVATEALPGLIEYEYHCPGRPGTSHGAVQLDDSAVGTPVHIPLNCRR